MKIKTEMKFGTEMELVLFTSASVHIYLPSLLEKSIQFDNLAISLAKMKVLRRQSLGLCDLG